MVATVPLMLVLGGHLGGQKTDAGVMLAIETIVGEDKRGQAAFIMGGTAFVYTEQDWTNHQSALADALTETFIAQTWAVTPELRRELATGYIALTKHASDEAMMEHWVSLRRYYGRRPIMH